jgi:uncharacterized membrane protein
VNVPGLVFDPPPWTASVAFIDTALVGLVAMVATQLSPFEEL